METGLSLLVSIKPKNYTEQEQYILSNDLLIQIHKSGLNAIRQSSSNSHPTGKGTPIDVNTLLITLASAGAFNILIQAIKDWALTSENRQVKIKLDVKEQVLELDYSPTETSEKELTEFIKKLSKVMKDG